MTMKVLYRIRANQICLTFGGLVAIVLALALGGCASGAAREAKARKTSPYYQRYTIAVDYIFAGREREALALLQPIALDSTQENRLQDAATFWMGYCYQELGRKDAAVRTFETVIEKYPDTKYARSAQDRLDIIRKWPQMPRVPKIPPVGGPAPR